MMLSLDFRAVRLAAEHPAGASVPTDWTGEADRR
jgi:hypothetical protein